MNCSTDIYLQNIILRLFTANEEPFICLNPVKLAQMLVSVLVLNQTKVYQFDSQKFWGKETTKRPDPEVLVNVLEAVAKQGVLRESLIPLLWQVGLKDSFELTEMTSYTKRWNV
jgi:hypothetical protein